MHGIREQHIPKFDPRIELANRHFSEQKLEQAEALLREVISEDGSNREALESLVIICLQSGRATDAEVHLTHLVGCYPADALYCERLATLLLNLGKADAAIAHYRALLDHYPELNNSRYNLARLLKRAGYAGAALQEYAECLRRGIEHPEEVHTNISVIHTQANNDELAEAALQTALEINPAYIPALFNLGQLQEERGDWAVAEALFERVLKRQPLHAGALTHLADGRVISDPVDPLLLRMKRAVRQDGIAKDAEESLLYALGKAHDDLRLYGEAFPYYMRANQLSRLRAGAYDPRAWEQAITGIIAHCDQAWLQSITPVSQAPLVFICGMYRSGSTLLEQMLGAHPALTAGGEISYFHRNLAPFPASLLQMSAAELGKLGKGYVDYLATTYVDGQSTINKRPDNFLHLGLIKALFPNARIVNTLRESQDNCLSIYFQSLDKAASYANDLLDIAHYYRQYHRLMQHWQGLFAENIHSVSYDELVVEPRLEIAAALQFLELDWHDDCLNFTATDSRVRTASLHQVRRALYQSSAGRRRNYAGYIDKLPEYLPPVK